MTEQATGLEIKQVLVGLHRYQRNELARYSKALIRGRSDLIREAVDLWLRAKRIQDDKNKAVKQEE